MLEWLPGLAWYARKQPVSRCPLRNYTIMDHKVIYTKSFNGHLRRLQQQGLKKTVQAVRATISEAGMSGEIRSLPRTKYGETRLPNVEKYDLSDGYRLVVQLVDGVAKTRAFLFAGTHDDADRWLDAHRNYRWVKSATDGTLDLVQVTESKEHRYVPADRVDLDSSEDTLGLPLLRLLSIDNWETIKLPDEAERLARSLSGSDYERDAEGILERLEQLAGWDKASFVFDLISHAHAQEWQEFHSRLNVAKGAATIASPTEIVPAMLSTENSESFVTFDDTIDLGDFFVDHSLADWMLFLHPEQKKVADKEFKGPARLRGVSGSGKTCVLVHRARRLAKKYGQPVLLVTLTESMRKLLERLVDDLCGVERDLLVTMTMSGLAKQIVQELNLRSASFYSTISAERQDQFIQSVLELVRSHPEVKRTPFAAMDNDSLRAFLRDEIPYIRGRLSNNELQQYLNTQTFQRRGRGLPLTDVARGVILDGVRHYERHLAAASVLDSEGIVIEALNLLVDKKFSRFRSVLCDEVQDLSQLEVALLSKLQTPEGEPISAAENGLFLVGDGAQSIYKRGFTLRRLGIEVSSRSFNLRKNYRNTYEILSAAFGLVSAYEFADIDEENIVKPLEPEFAKRRGSRPTLLRCSSLSEEAAAVAQAVHSLLAMGQTPGQVCVIGPSVKVRDEVQRALLRLNVPHSDLRQDADYDSDRVKVSTIESAKGHEFASVFIMGLVENILPITGLTEDELPREAARFYVAMTRARDSLTISYSPSVDYPASRFLRSIQNDCDEAQFRNGEIRRVIN